MKRSFVRPTSVACALACVLAAFATDGARAGSAPKHRLLAPTEEAKFTAQLRADALRTKPKVDALATRDALVRHRNPDVPDAKKAAPAALPSKFSWEDTGKVTSIKDQGQAGTCWTFADVGVLESDLLRREGIDTDLAEQDLIDCGRTGAVGRLELGVSYESENPYKGIDAPNDPSPACKKNATPFYVEGIVGLSTQDPAAFPQDPVRTEVIKRAVLEHGPVVVNMHIPNGSGFFDVSNAKPFTETIPLVYDNYPKAGDVRNNGSHIVSIIGWDDALGAWRIKNSWGTSWGDHGFGYITFGSNRIGMGASYYALGSPDVLTSAIWERSADDEIHVDAWPYAYFQSKYDDLWKKGYRITQLATSVSNGHVYYSASWRKGSDAEVQYYGLPYAELKAKYDALFKDGWRIHLLDNYVLGSTVYYSAVWRKTGGEEYPWYELPYEEFQKKYDDLWKKGFRLEVLSNPVVDGQVKYTGVWKKSSDAEMQYYGQGYADFQKKYDALWKDGWRIHLLSNYRLDNKVYFNATWRKSQSAETQWYAMSSDAYGEKSQELAKSGWRVRLLDTY